MSNKLSKKRKNTSVTQRVNKEEFEAMIDNTFHLCKLCGYNVLSDKYDFTSSELENYKKGMTAFFSMYSAGLVSTAHLEEECRKVGVQPEEFVKSIPRQTKMKLTKYKDNNPRITKEETNRIISAPFFAYSYIATALLTKEFHWDKEKILQFEHWMREYFESIARGFLEGTDIEQMLLEEYQFTTAI